MSPTRVREVTPPSTLLDAPATPVLRIDASANDSEGDANLRDARERITAALDRAAAIDRFGADVGATLDWCHDAAEAVAPLKDAGALATWELLATVASRSVAAARILEPHLDARNILHDAASEIWHRNPSATWGVYAAEAPGATVAARISASGEWLLSGTKAWCSLAGELTHALVVAQVGDARRLFAVDLRQTSIRPRSGPWTPKGLPGIVSAPVDFDDAAAEPVGEVGWYHSRDGFAWGGMSVAACWWGGAVSISNEIARAAAERGDQLALVHAGQVDGALWGARATLREAARAIDEGSPLGHEKALSERVRWVISQAAETTLAAADQALGPAPLATNDWFATQVADLHLYLRQHHGLRDAARLGRLSAQSNEVC